MKKNKTTFFMVLFFFIGLMVLLYPSISSYTNNKIQSKAVNKYEELLKNIEEIDYEAYFKDAEEYNKKLVKIANPLISYKKLGSAKDILNVSGTGMIGYISIDKIKVELPIYYGTSDEILNIASGLLEGSSFPVGGKGTHAVISAHRGLPSSKLFTDLNKIEKGDTFVIKVFDKTMTYEVDQILIVQPNETDSLAINPKEDYVTLMTCTPYGINSHRLLVRGHRIENANAKAYVSTEAFKVNKLIVTSIACMPIIFIWLIIVAFKPIKNNKKIYNKYVYPNGIKN
ncbi:MAG: class C sortase [bacterium]|nr:class C sortase [bacterium]